MWNGKHRGLDSQVSANGREIRFAGPGTSFDCDSNRGITDVPTQPFERAAVPFVVDPDQMPHHLPGTVQKYSARYTASEPGARFFADRTKPSSTSCQHEK